MKEGVRGDELGPSIESSFHRCSSLAVAEEVPASRLVAGVTYRHHGLLLADDCATDLPLEDVSASLEAVDCCNMGHQLQLKHRKSVINHQNFNWMTCQRQGNASFMCYMEHQQVAEKWELVLDC